MICSFLAIDNIYKYISIMGNNLTPCSIATRKENIYFWTPHFKFTEREKNNDNDFLKTNGNSVDPYDSRISQCGKDSFKKLRTYKIHSNYD